MVVAVGVDERAMLPHRQADFHAERLGVAVDRLAIQLIEHPELDRVGGLIHRLHAVHHHAARAGGEVEVEERADGVQRVVVRRLPIPVELPRPVRRRHLEIAHAADPLQRVAVERVHLVRRGIGLGHRRHRVSPLFERPVEEPRRVLVVLLAVAATVHVEDHAARAVGDPSVVGEGQPEVRLADPRGAVDDGERARQQASAEHRVEPGDAGRDACGHSMDSTPGSPTRPFVWN
jgi:hypothetical protein